MAEREVVRRFGKVALVGRPNAGKSTLLNSLLREKLAIVSEKPQTTRNRIVGILSEKRGQMLLLDTPGVHKGRHRLNRRMVRAATDALNEADIVCLLADAAAPFGGGDEYMIELVQRAQAPKVAVLNKVDIMAKEALLPRIARYAETALFDEIVPLSARSGDGVALLADLLWERLPEGAARYDEDLLTLHPERFLVAERIREKLLSHTRQELPYSTAVIIDSWEEEERGGLVSILVTILVERESQRRIVLGKEGRMIRAISTDARLDLEQYLERRVFLRAHVRCEANWREKGQILERLDKEARNVDLGASIEKSEGGS